MPHSALPSPSRAARFVLFFASSARGDVVERIHWVEGDRFGDGEAVDAGWIAATLGVSERTVENQLRRARRRLGVATTAQAVKVAIRNGDIEA
ncbi:response regulator transcription factor [Ensifer sp. B1-9]|uniref:response regulator transcription factor n=1 Tax=Ensifer sp. B1-9 TaxID=3141455 RepID=UPI003D20CC8E